MPKLQTLINDNKVEICLVDEVIKIGLMEMINQFESFKKKHILPFKVSRYGAF